MDMRDDEIARRTQKIHQLAVEGNTQEAKNQFRELVQDSMAWCNNCRKYAPIELDKSTSDKPFYFCILCGQHIKKMNIRKDRVIELKFHRLK
jgi:hypothetical protein